MAEIYRTPDPNIWFNPGNFRQLPGETIAQALNSLKAGQAINLLVNGQAGTWIRFAGNPPAMGLRATNAAVRQLWTTINIGTWVSIDLAPQAPAGAEAPAGA